MHGSFISYPRQNALKKSRDLQVIISLLKESGLVRWIKCLCVFELILFITIYTFRPITKKTSTFVSC